MHVFDPQTVYAFVLVAELRSFTKAARVLNSTQSAISGKLKRLEEKLGQRLLERTPRAIRLSAAGELFLGPARELVAAHQRAAKALMPENQRLTLGVSHHLIGPDMPLLLQAFSQVKPNCIFSLQTGSTRDLLDRYDNGLLDAVIVLRHEESHRDGEIIGTARFIWISAKSHAPAQNEPLALVTQPSPCNIRAITLDALEKTGRVWREAFIGTGAIIIGAAVAANIGVGVVASGAMPEGTQDIGKQLGLPVLPSRDIILHSRITNSHAKSILDLLIRNFKSQASFARQLKAQ